MKLTLISDERFGGDTTAINRHRVKTYKDEKGNTYQLDRITDGIPPFHCAYGPMQHEFQGICPTFYVTGSNKRGYFGDGISIKKAEKIFFKSLGVTELEINL